MNTVPFTPAWRPLSPEGLERLCLACRTYHWLSIVRAWKAGRLRSVVIGLQDFWPPARVYDPAATPGPAVVILGCDGDPPLPPGEVPHVRRALAWATHVMIHAAGAEDWHYELVVEAAVVDHGRVLVVETCTRHRDAWVAEVGRCARPDAALLLVDVPPGAPPHPLPNTRH